MLNESNLEAAITLLEKIRDKVSQNETRALIEQLLHKATADSDTTALLSPALLASIKEKLLNDDIIDVDGLLAEQDKEKELGYRYQLEQTKRYLMKLFGGDEEV